MVDGKKRTGGESLGTSPTQTSSVLAPLGPPARTSSARIPPYRWRSSGNPSAPAAARGSTDSSSLQWWSGSRHTASLTSWAWSTTKDLIIKEGKRRLGCRGGGVRQGIAEKFKLAEKGG